MLPEDKILDAVSMGYRETWELADYFNVTETLVKKAVCLYTNGNLAVDMYL
ncbi:MAG: hypothetical protein VB055_03075 [Oscillospiraceae bacterium]|nr:hypothetical protein [Oscillospiraceae bacterium]